MAGRWYGIVVDGRLGADRFVSARLLGRALRRIDAQGLFRCSLCGQLHVGWGPCGPCGKIVPPEPVWETPRLLVGSVCYPPEQVRVPAGLVSAVALSDEEGRQRGALSDDEARLFLAGYAEEQQA